MVNFNWSVTDNFDTSLTCNLTINGTVNVSSIASSNGSFTNYSIRWFENGYYVWNITCVDDVGNVNTSLTSNFTVDLDYPYCHNSTGNATISTSTTWTTSHICDNVVVTI